MYNWIEIIYVSNAILKKAHNWFLCQKFDNWPAESWKCFFLSRSNWLPKNQDYADLKGLVYLYEKNAAPPSPTKKEEEANI